MSRILSVPSALGLLLDVVADPAAIAPTLATGVWIVSGEPLVAHLAAAFHKRLPKATLINLYGTTEVREGRSIPYIYIYIFKKKHKSEALSSRGWICRSSFFSIQLFANSEISDLTHPPPLSR